VERATRPEFTLNFSTLSYDQLTVVFHGRRLPDPGQIDINAQVAACPETSMTLGSVPQSDFQAMIAPEVTPAESYQPLNRALSTIPGYPHPEHDG
jgi:hypothetical protein